MGPDGNTELRRVRAERWPTTPPTTSTSSSGTATTTPPAGQQRVRGLRPAAQPPRRRGRRQRLPHLRHGPDGNAELRRPHAGVAYNPPTTSTSSSGTATTPPHEDEFEIFGQRLTRTGARGGANDFRISDMGPDGNANFAAYAAGRGLQRRRQRVPRRLGRRRQHRPAVDNETEIFGQRLDAPRRRGRRERLPHLRHGAGRQRRTSTPTSRPWPTTPPTTSTSSSGTATTTPTRSSTRRSRSSASGSTATGARPAPTTSASPTWAPTAMRTTLPSSRRCLQRRHQPVPGQLVGRRQHRAARQRRKRDLRQAAGRTSTAERWGNAPRGSRGRRRAAAHRPAAVPDGSAPTGPAGACVAPHTRRVRYRLRAARSDSASSAPRRPPRTGQCRRPTRNNRGRPRCKRYRTLSGSFSHKGKAGRNRLKFSGRLARRKLRPAKYRLVATAKDTAGNRSTPKRKLSESSAELDRQPDNT